MSRRGRRDGRAGRKGSGAAVAPVTRAGEVDPAPPGGSRPPGQRLFEMPFSAVAPRLVHPDLGLHTLVARAGHNAAYTIDVTLLDAPDHRLIRSGVLLAHRVLDGRGEWYLTAPDWEPLLPRDRVELMGHSDLPDELADLIRPLRRRAALGPVAALTCDRREFALRDAGGETLALLRDDKVTVRRGGLTTARYREVVLTPVGRSLDEDQTAWLERALTGAGSTLVPRFPRLVARLGAPATGPGDVPHVDPPPPDAPFKRFVGQLLGRRLRALVEADLAVRGGDPEAPARVRATAAALAGELDGLRVGVDAGWVADLVDELRWLAGADDDPAEHLVARLRSQRHLALLDGLVGTARAPRLGEHGSAPAAAELERLLTAAVDDLAAAVDAAAVDGPPAAWADVALRLRRLEALAGLAAPVLPTRSAAVLRRLRKPRRRLDAVCAGPVDEQAAVAAAAGLDPVAAFAAGRAWERQVGESRAAREAFRTAADRATRRLRERSAG